MPEKALIFETSELQDMNLFQVAYESALMHNNGEIKYNLYSNNCTDAVCRIIEGAGINIYNPSTTVRPNSWLEELLKRYSK